MYNFLLKNGTAVAMGIGMALIVIFMISIFVGFNSAGYDIGSDLVDVDKSSINFFNPGLYITILLGVLAALFMLGGIIRDIALNGKKGLKFILGLVVLIVLFVVLYNTSAYETGGKWDVLYKDNFVTEGSSRLVSAGIYTCGLLLLLSVLSIVYSEVRSFIK